MNFPVYPAVFIVAEVASKLVRQQSSHRDRADPLGLLAARRALHPLFRGRIGIHLRNLLDVHDEEASFRPIH